MRIIIPIMLISILSGCTFPPMKAHARTGVTVVGQTTPVKQKPVVKSTAPEVPASTPTTVTEAAPGAPVVMSLAHDNTIYIWDPAADAFYYVVDGKKKYMPEGWHGHRGHGHRD